MKNFIKLLAGFVFCAVILVSSNVEAKAITPEEYQMAMYGAYYAGNDDLMNSYMNQYNQYFTQYMQEVQHAMMVQEAVTYLNNYEPYADPEMYYGYANFVTGGDFANMYGSMNDYVSLIGYQVQEWNKHVKVMKQYQEVIGQMQGLEDIYKLGEQYKSYSGGVNPYASTVNQAANVYAAWIKSVSKYIF